jgi:hypothetical protein
MLPVVRYRKVNAMQTVEVQTDIRSVLREFYVCEVTTVNRQGQPITWPSAAYYDEATGEIILTACIAFPVKAFNARRHPQVSLLYSDPTGSRLVEAPAVLVQGDATVAEIQDYLNPQVLGWMRTSAHHQPDVRRFIANRFVRKLFAWYLFQRLLIKVHPRCMFVWLRGDFSVTPIEIEVNNVE